jgi:hypothetical protein
MMNDSALITKCQYIGPEQDPLNDWPVKTCGCKAIYGKAYCQEHFDIVYQKGTALRKRKKEMRVAQAVWDLESEMNAVIEELLNEDEINI